jgi:hypothetical protein
MQFRRHTGRILHQEDFVNTNPPAHETSCSDPYMWWHTLAQWSIVRLNKVSLVH